MRLRSESYREDIALTKDISDIQQKRQLWREIASSAESGWDFGSRWFADGKRLETIETTNIVPVDLNAFICWNMDILSYLYDQVGASHKLVLDFISVYLQAMTRRATSIT